VTDTAIDITHLKTWEGRREQHVDTITSQLLRGFRALLDEEPGEAATGEIVPQGLHWCLSPPTVAMRDIGPDGHPARGGFLPPVPLPRRMWAGGRLTFHDALRVGDAVTRRSIVRSVALKQGRTGPLCFVTVAHEVSSERGRAIEEEHDIVYRSLTQEGAVAPPMASGKGDAQLSETIVPDPVLLFRYSALTFNGHRIHYDRTYVTEVEGYPGLIVHGPLQATLLLRLAGKLGGSPPRRFAFRGVSPLFDLAPFTVRAKPEATGAALWVAGEDGRLHMEATAGW